LFLNKLISSNIETFRRPQYIRENKEDFLTVITRIEEIIYEQKFTGSASGFFNANIIARDLGLADKKEVDNKLSVGPNYDEFIEQSDKQKEAFSILERGKEISTLLYGAAGGGKSVLLAEWQAARRVFNPETSGLIGRDTLINLKKTTLVTFFRVWKKHWQNNPWGVTMKPNFQENTLNFSNGSIIYLKGLAYNSSDPEGTDFGSLELTDAAIDEANGCSEKYVNITESRIRYNLIDGRSPMLLLANPGYDWIRNRFWKDAKGNRIMLKPHEAFIFAKLTDNPDPIFQENYRRQLEKLPPYDRLLYGDWDAVRSADNPFLHAFDETRHVGIAGYNENLLIC